MERDAYHDPRRERAWMPTSSQGAMQMRKLITVGAALVLGLTAAGHDVTATHSPAAVVQNGTSFFKARSRSRATP